ncbi:MAG: glucosamine-6-phosphate deaminase [Victivallales bacterium]|jgi:glucosamine-6-phosphate deaminase|nr:glucosamine-6-phosphate deaminase [Victivallales bacterium]
MEVIIRPTTKEAVNLTAKLIAEAINQKPFFKLGLATGATMEAVYADLVAMNQAKEVDFSLVHTFNLDEYIGLDPEDPNSYRYYMNKHLFSKINIDMRNTNLPNGLAEDEIAEGLRYESAIAAAGGIDLQLLGIGNDGHIGFNEPISSLAGRTRSKALTPATYAQNSVYFTPPESMPKRAFTMGVGTILGAERIVMLITGAKKAEIAAKAIEGPVTSMVTGSALQMHPRTVVVLDEAAAANLTQKDYYNWVFANEPEWKPYR